MFFCWFFSAENLKRQFDKEFGPPWNVVVGETYTCDIDYDSNFLYQFLYGPVAVLAWRVRKFPYYWFVLFKIKSDLIIFFVTSVEAYYQLRSIILVKKKYLEKIHWWRKKRKRIPRSGFRFDGKITMSWIQQSPF